MGRGGSEATRHQGGDRTAHSTWFGAAAQSSVPMSVAPKPAQARPPTACILLPPFLSLQLECGAGREEKQKVEWLHQSVWEGGEVQNVRRCGVLSRVNCVCEDGRRFERMG